MRMNICAGLLLLLLSTNAFAQAQPSPTPPVLSNGTQQQPTAQPTPEDVDPADVVTVSANLVSVPVVVMNRQGQFITDLQRNDFRIFEDGHEQPIAHFSNVDQAFSVVLLIDTSGSTTPFLEQIKSAAKAFVEQLRPTDTIRPVYFHGEIKALTAEGINDPKLFETAIDRIAPGPWQMGTRLYDAVDFGLNALQPVSARKAVILLTDGENTWGKATKKSTLREAEESDVVVYTVQYGDDLVADTYLQQLAEKTGGRYFRGGDVNAIRQSFATVAAELRRQYVLGYRLNEGKAGVRIIKVKVNRKRVAVRARRFYTYGQH